MDPKKSYIGFRNSADNSTLELFFTDFIFDGINWSTFEETNMVQDTIDKVKAANPSKILVTINSLGGDVMIGLAIYNFLKNYKAKVEVNVIGFAGSIASVMAMCANKGKLKMANNSFMIIHAASTLAMGNAKEMRDQADVLDKVSNEIADIYAQRSGKEASYFTNLWADGGDVWFTAKEAKELGLVDELLDAVVATARIDIASYGYKNIPTALITNTSNKNIMAFEEVLIAAGTDSFEVVEGGFLLEENHLTAIKNKLVAAASNMQAATTRDAENAAALITANADVARLTAEAVTATTEKENVDRVIIAKDAEIVRLEAKVAELGAQSSGAGTALTQIGDEHIEKTEVPFHASAANKANAWADKHLPKQKAK